MHIRMLVLGREGWCVCVCSCVLGREIVWRLIERVVHIGSRSVCAEL